MHFPIVFLLSACLTLGVSRSEAAWKSHEGICQRAPYRDHACLTEYEPAVQYCEFHYPPRVECETVFETKTVVQWKSAQCGQPPSYATPSQHYARDAEAYGNSDNGDAWRWSQLKNKGHHVLQTFCHCIGYPRTRYDIITKYATQTVYKTRKCQKTKTSTSEISPETTTTASTSSQSTTQEQNPISNTLESSSSTTTVVTTSTAQTTATSTMPITTEVTSTSTEESSSSIPSSSVLTTTTSTATSASGQEPVSVVDSTTTSASTAASTTASTTPTTTPSPTTTSTTPNTTTPSTTTRSTTPSATTTSTAPSTTTRSTTPSTTARTLSSTTTSARVSTTTTTISTTSSTTTSTTTEACATQFILQVDDAVGSYLLTEPGNSRGANVQLVAARDQATVYTLEGTTVLDGAAPWSVLDQQNGQILVSASNAGSSSAIICSLDGGELSCQGPDPNFPEATLQFCKVPSPLRKLYLSNGVQPNCAAYTITARDVVVTCGASSTTAPTTSPTCLPSGPGVVGIASSGATCTYNVLCGMTYGEAADHVNIQSTLQDCINYAAGVGATKFSFNENSQDCAVFTSTSSSTGGPLLPVQHVDSGVLGQCQPAPVSFSASTSTSISAASTTAAAVAKCTGEFLLAAQGNGGYLANLPGDNTETNQGGNVGLVSEALQATTWSLNGNDIIINGGSWAKSSGAGVIHVETYQQQGANADQPPLCALGGGNVLSCRDQNVAFLNTFQVCPDYPNQLMLGDGLIPNVNGETSDCTEYTFTAICQ